MEIIESSWKNIYLVNDEPMTCDKFNSKLDDALSSETDIFDDYLDEQGTIEVRGIDFYPSQILKHLDETAYRTELNDFVDYRRTIVINDLERGREERIDHTWFAIVSEDLAEEVIFDLFEITTEKGLASTKDYNADLIEEGITNMLEDDYGRYIDDYTWQFVEGYNPEDPSTWQVVVKDIKWDGVYDE